MGITDYTAPFQLVAKVTRSWRVGLPTTQLQCLLTQLVAKVTKSWGVGLPVGMTDYTAPTPPPLSLLLKLLTFIFSPLYISWSHATQDLWYNKLGATGSNTADQT